MSEKQNTPTPEPTPETRELTNHDVKSDPLFQKVAGELSALKAQIAEAQQAEQAAKEQAELEQAKKAGEFEKVLEMNARKLEQMEAQHRAELLKRDLTTELVKAGARNEVFLKGAIAAYDGESDISEYVRALTESDDHKPFFGQLEQSRQTKQEPRGVAPSGNASSWAQIRAMEKSDDPKQRAEAGRLILDYAKKHGEMPPE